MGKPHKYANGSVTIDTTLTDDEVVDIVRKIVDSTKNFGIEGSADGVVRVKVKSWAKITQMTFDVNYAPSAGGTRVCTKIVDYLTEQGKVLVFIPVGPKTMLAWKQYKQFMATLAAGLAAADPAARSTIVEIPVAF